MKAHLNFLVVAAGVAAGFVVMLWTGFHLHGQVAPPPIDDLFPLAAVVLAAALTWLCYLATTWLGDAARRRRDWARAQADIDRARRDRGERIARLRTDPVRRIYAERMERGESWGDAQIDYDLDPDAVATCVHLAPIERAMRRHGIAVRLLYNDNVHAPCTIDEAELKRQFGMAAPAWYGLVPQYDRGGYEEPPAAMIRCDAHGAIIHCVEAGMAKPETPRFPVSR